jgi:Trp operon repressor
MNVLKPQKRNDVIALIRANVSQREIHERLGVDRLLHCNYNVN